MKTTTTIDKIAGFVDREVTLSGWLYNKRESKKLQFLQIRDGTGIIQAIVSIKDVDEETWSAGQSLTQESSLYITGTVSKHPKRDEYELQVKSGGINIIQVTEDYPITPKDHGTGYLFEHRHLWLRSQKPWALLRIRSEVIQAIRTFFYEDGYLAFDSPMFTPSAVEGTTTLFNVDYFGETAFLTQSGQLYGEAGAMAHRKIVVFGPTFRAEKSKTRRHLTEFWMIEPEVAFFDLEDNFELMERMTMYVIEWVLDKCRKELEILERDTSLLEKIKLPFIRMHYDDAVKELNELRKKAGINEEFEWGGDLGSPDETMLTEAHENPIFLHHFPREIKAFYMAPDPDDERVSLSVDMLAPEGYGEIIGGGQRADDEKYVIEQIKKHDLPQEAFEWFLDLRRYGTNPHGGFGLGLERLVAWLAGVQSIRGCIPFPRTIEKVYP